ncbi:MAG: pyruvate dehydrogenase complex E1 component subunit beta [Planctomycetaceae bacterium]|nr:pyruvate dehydrogenase complex E1 component subunit beta [Planctomycetaceae bacterium]
MTVLRYREAVKAAMIEEMDRDERVYLMGEEVGYYQGAYKVSEGMLERFGPRRVIDTPITESGFTGISIGAAMVGLRPIVEYMTFNFSAVAFDQILNNAAKLRQMSGGQLSVPIVFRAPNGSARQVGSQHSHAMEHFYAHIPGLKVLAPAMPADAKGLLKSSIRADDPIVFIEHENLYGEKGKVPDGEHLVPLGLAEVKRPGSDVSLITYSRSLKATLAAAEELAGEGIEAEVIDLRTIRPLDFEALLASVVKTHRAVIVEEDWPYCGVGAGIADRIYQVAFDELDAPIRRVAAKDAPIPYNRYLEASMLPSVDRIVAQVNDVLYKK